MHLLSRRWSRRNPKHFQLACGRCHGTFPLNSGRTRCPSCYNPILERVRIPTNTRNIIAAILLILTVSGYVIIFF